MNTLRHVVLHGLKDDPRRVLCLFKIGHLVELGFPSELSPLVFLCGEQDFVPGGTALSRLDPGGLEDMLCVVKWTLGRGQRAAELRRLGSDSGSARSRDAHSTIPCASGTSRTGCEIRARQTAVLELLPDEETKSFNFHWSPRR
jgi:hypothetical protein